MSDLIVAGQKLAFDDAGKQGLRRALDGLAEPALHQHAEVRRLIELDWEWYSCKPAQRERSQPFFGASNIVYPLIATHANNIQARRLLTMFATGDIWISKTQNEAWRKRAREYVNLLNRDADDNQFDLKTPMSDVLLESTVVSDGILALQWGRRVRHRFVPGSKVPRAVTLHNGIHALAVPRAQMCWQADRSLNESEFVLRTIYMTWGDLVRAARPEAEGGAGWDAPSIGKIRGSRVGTDSPLGSWMDLCALPVDGPELTQPYEIIEMWVEWPLLKGLRVPGPDEDTFGLPRPAIVIYWERNTHEILHVMAHPYPIAGWPFYQFSYRRAGPNRAHNRGLAKELAHFQAGTSTMINQAVDAVTWGNSILGLTSDPELMGKRFQPGLNSCSDVTLTNFGAKPQPFIQPEMALISLMLAGAERLSGQSDPNFGRESRSGGHPAPATSTLALLQQGQTVLSRTIMFDRMELSRFGEDALVLMQFFEAAQNGNRIQRIIGAGDAAELKTIEFPEDSLAGTLEMDVRAVSEADNAEADFQRAVQVDQVCTNYYAKVIQGLNVAIQAATALASGQVEPRLGQMLIQATFQSIKAFTESTERILSAANVDDLESFITAVRGAQQDPTPGNLQAMRQLASEQLAGAGQPPPAVAVSPGGIPAAQAGPTPAPDGQLQSPA